MLIRRITIISVMGIAYACSFVSVIIPADNTECPRIRESLVAYLYDDSLCRRRYISYPCPERLYSNNNNNNNNKKRFMLFMIFTQEIRSTTSILMSGNDNSKINC